MFFFCLAWMRLKNGKENDKTQTLNQKKKKIKAMNDAWEKSTGNTELQFEFAWDFEKIDEKWRWDVDDMLRPVKTIYWNFYSTFRFGPTSAISFRNQFLIEMNLMPFFCVLENGIFGFLSIHSSPSTRNKWFYFFFVNLIERENEIKKKQIYVPCTSQHSAITSKTEINYVKRCERMNIVHYESSRKEEITNGI